MRHLRLFVALFAVASISVLVGTQAPSKNLAIVNGETIADADVAHMADGRIRQLIESRDESQSDAAIEHAKLSIRWDALNYLVERHLLRAEASRLMISEDALIEKEIDNRIPDIPLEEVEAFIASNIVRMPMVKNLSHPEAISQVRGYLTVQAEKLIRTDYVYKLSKQYGVKTFLDPLRSEIATTGYPARGTTNAPVTIVEFSDFECKECAALDETLNALQRTNGEKLRVVYRQFPLAYINANAQKAAEASLCAADQERFWEFHDALFKNQAKLTANDLKNRAESLKLDTAIFNDCLDSGKHVAGIDKEIDEAYSAGVMSAPTIFINGRILYGNRPDREIQAIIDEELHHSGN